MDPSLTLASASAQHHHHTLEHNPAFLDPALAQEDIDAATAEIINASIRTAAQAHAAAAAEAEAAEAVVAEAVAEATGGSPEIGHLYEQDEEAVAGPSSAPPRPSNIVVPSTGSLYPYAPPQRDESTPHPLEETFASRADFDAWLAIETSWCHYVQRRVTNPEKRAEERAKARDKAHEKKLAEMDPEEAAREPPLKKRHRTRTSAVVHKITYTCHHAGKYEPQHNTNLPQERLRMNTKTSVKCGCLSRVVMNEMDDSTIKVAFWWKHNGHDPFAEKEAETYRLPQSVTDWLIDQFQKGKEPEDIIKLLNIPEEEKLERIRRATGASISTSTPIPADENIDPVLTGSEGHAGDLGSGAGGDGVGEGGEPLGGVEDEDLPPIIAYGLQIKYPDLYNRYRKVGPPLRSRKSELAEVGKSRGMGEGSKGKSGAGGAKRGKKRKGDPAEGEQGEMESGTVVQKGVIIPNKSGPKGNKRAKGKGKEAEVALADGLGDVGEPMQVDGEAEGGDAVGQPIDSTADQPPQIYLVSDDFTFDDLVENDHLHQLPDDTHQPAPSHSLPSGEPISSSGLGPSTSTDPAGDVFGPGGAIVQPAAAGGDLGSGQGQGSGEGEDGVELMDEEETTRMTEELEKLANEITSTWRH